MEQVFTFMKKTQKLWAFLLLPAQNITALLLADPLYENITHIAYAKQHFGFVLLWAFSCSFYLWCFTWLFMRRITYQKKSGYALLTLLCLGMIISVCIPYETQSPLCSRIHVDLAMVSTIGYLLFFCYLLVQYHFYDPLHARTILSLYISIVLFLSLLFLLVGSVCTWMESLFVITMGLLHLKIQRRFT